MPEARRLVRHGLMANAPVGCVALPAGLSSTMPAARSASRATSGTGRHRRISCRAWPAARPATTSACESRFLAARACDLLRPSSRAPRARRLNAEVRTGFPDPSSSTRSCSRACTCGAHFDPQAQAGNTSRHTRQEAGRHESRPAVCLTDHGGVGRECARGHHSGCGHQISMVRARVVTSGTSGTCIMTDLAGVSWRG